MKTYRGTIPVCVSAINKASMMFGSEMALAAALGVSRQLLNHWKYNMIIPFNKAFDICLITKCKIDLDEICPTLRKKVKQYHMMILKKYGHAATQ